MGALLLFFDGGGAKKEAKLGQNWGKMGRNGGEERRGNEPKLEPLAAMGFNLGGGSDDSKALLGGGLNYSLIMVL